MKNIVWSNLGVKMAFFGTRVGQVAFDRSQKVQCQDTLIKYSIYDNRCKDHEKKAWNQVVICIKWV